MFIYLGTLLTSIIIWKSLFLKFWQLPWTHRRRAYFPVNGVLASRVVCNMWRTIWKPICCMQLVTKWLTYDSGPHVMVLVLAIMMGEGITLLCYPSWWIETQISISSPLLRELWLVLNFWLRGGGWSLHLALK